MVYKQNHWKKSTLITLERLKEQNDEGKSPTSSFFHNGAIATWLSILKVGGYVDHDGSGYKINDKGIRLISELKKTQFTRTRKKSKKVNHDEKDTKKKEDDATFSVDIKGEAYSTKFSIHTNQKKLAKALSAFHDELEK